MFHKILCPIDFSEASLRGLSVAVELALQNNAEVCVLHVEPPINEIASVNAYHAYDETTAARSAQAVKNLCNVIEDKIPAAVHSRPLLKRGAAADEIVRAAREDESDLIVLTAQDTSEQSDGTLGSIAEAVLRSAHCPVLTIEALPCTAPNASPPCNLDVQTEGDCDKSQEATN